MKMFGNLSSQGLEDTKDSMGGGSFLKDTNIYAGTIKMAYAKNSASSDSVAMAIQIDIDGQEYREDLWVVNKKGENFYVDGKDPTKKHPLMGFTHANDICLMTTDMELAELSTEEKTISLYDFDARKDMPTKADVFTDLIGKEIKVAIVRQIVDKNTKQDDGRYVPSGETREENSIEKVFHAPTNMTVVEARQGLEEPVFHDKWKLANEGKPPRDRSKGVTKGGGKAPGTAGAPGAAGAAKPSGLFGKKTA
jgi:hypothetical protein